MTEEENPNHPDAPLTQPPVVEETVAKAAPPAIVEAAPASTPADAFGFAAQVGVDPGVWLAKTIEYWDESLQALIAHSGDLAETRRIEEAIELQTRFAISRLDRLNQQLREFFELAVGGIGVANPGRARQAVAAPASAGSRRSSRAGSTSLPA
jgi:hypothetical protein